MKKLFHFLVKLIAYFLIIVFGVLLSFYLLAPVYNFSGPVPFSGNKLYNPYEKVDPNNWLKYNFQVQSKAWLGITDGRKNTNELIDSVYNILGYDHVATSDYQKINYYGKESPSFIPTYEHGYNIFKTHQVCIDADKVLWVDMMLGQTISMKQWIIDQLSENTRFIVLAHPLLRDGYSLSDMDFLTNYQGIEVLNNMRISTDHWDRALSSGQMAFIIANDDAHDVLNTNDVGRRFTMINAKDTRKETIMTSLEAGNCYGMDFFRVDDEPMNDKVLRSKNLPKLISAKVISDSLFVVTDSVATEVKFISDNGKVVKLLENTDTSWCQMPTDATYLRTEIKFNDNSVMYLNPIIRYGGDFPKSEKTAEVDTKATLMLRMIYFIIALTIAYTIARYRKQRNKYNNE